MTESFAFAPPDVEEFVISWLAPLGPAGSAGAERPSGAVLPYRMVTRVAGTDDLFFDDPVVSVHTFAATRTAAADAAKVTHLRMLVLINDPLTDVTMFDGSLANADHVETVEKPYWVDYKDVAIRRYVARYRLGLHFAAV